MDGVAEEAAGEGLPPAVAGVRIKRRSGPKTRKNEALGIVDTPREKQRKTSSSTCQSLRPQGTNSRSAEHGKKSRRGKRGQKRRDKGIVTDDSVPIDVEVTSGSISQPIQVERSDGGSGRPDDRSAPRAKKRQPQPGVASASRNGKRRQESQAFPQHVSAEEAVEGLKSGVLVQGTLRINPRRYQDAFITNPDRSLPDLLIQGVKERNRALHGDDVIVRLQPQSKWCVMHERISEYLHKETEESDDIQLKMSALSITDQDSASHSVTDLSDGVASVQENKMCKENDRDATVTAPDQSGVADGTLFPEQVPNDSPQKKTILDQEVPKARSPSDKKSRQSGKKHHQAKKARARTSDSDNATGTTSNSSFTGAVSHQGANTSGVRYALEDVLKHRCWEKFIQRTAVVVYIKGKKHSRKAAGSLKVFGDNNSDYALFSPTDARVPRMKIPKEQCPQTFFNRPDDFRDALFLAEIHKWDLVPFAIGKLIKTIGDGSNIEAQTEAILLEKGIDATEFSPSVMACLPEFPFTIPAQEYATRRDFRKQCVFTVDPMSARDLDDALSAEELGNGRFQIAVHIADVSFFVPEQSELDKAAASRATSVYLVQKVVPMLPRPLCEDLCSLNPDVDRLTFTVEWTINEDGEIEEEWFGRSVIKSCCKLAYEHAQSMIDSPSKAFPDHELPPISNPWTSSDISKRVNILNNIAKTLRKRREENGALRLDLPKIVFNLDGETKSPQSYKLYAHRHSNKLIEEFMLLANISVAKKLVASFPKQAILRRHPEPKGNLMDRLDESLQKHGIFINFATSKTIADSLKNLPQCADGTDVGKFYAIVNMLSKPMELAQYFCSGSVDGSSDSFRHYALSVDYYTHFTSPIRRYPDILAHRLLRAALQNQTLTWDPPSMAIIADHCNDKKLEAKRVGERSCELYLALFIQECGPVDVRGVVLEVRETSVDVLVLDMAVVKRVYFERIASELTGPPCFSRSNVHPEIKLEWKQVDNGSENQATPIVQHIRLFSHLDITLMSDSRPFEFAAFLKKPILRLPSSQVGSGRNGET